MAGVSAPVTGLSARPRSLRAAREPAGLEIRGEEIVSRLNRSAAIKDRVRRPRRQPTLVIVIQAATSAETARTYESQ